MIAFIKKISFLLISVVSCFAVSGQKRTLPPVGSYSLISTTNSVFRRQSGKLEITNNDSAKVISFKTDSAIMDMYSAGGRGLLEDENKKGGDSINVYTDSIVVWLFKNGLLTPDLLIAAMNADMKLLDHKGDTQDVTMHINVKKVHLHTIRRIKLPASHTGKSSDLLFNVSISFDLPAGATALAVLRFSAIFDLELYLRGDRKPSTVNLADYLNHAVIKHLHYDGVEI